MKEQIVNVKSGPLPEPYQALAQKRRTGDDCYLGASDCFLWVDTPEGSEFWRSVYGGERPKIPLTGHLWLVVDKKTRKIKSVKRTRSDARDFSFSTETIIKVNYKEAK